MRSLQRAVFYQSGLVAGPRHAARAVCLQNLSLFAPTLCAPPLLPSEQMTPEAWKEGGPQGHLQRELSPPTSSHRPPPPTWALFIPSMVATTAQTSLFQPPEMRRRWKLGGFHWGWVVSMETPHPSSSPEWGPGTQLRHGGPRWQGLTQLGVEALGPQCPGGSAGSPGKLPGNQAVPETGRSREKQLAISLHPCRGLSVVSACPMSTLPS